MIEQLKILAQNPLIQLWAIVVGGSIIIGLILRKIIKFIKGIF